MQIWKHELPNPGEIRPIGTPVFTTSLHVAVDPKTGKAAWWVSVNPDDAPKIVNVICVGTGFTFPEGAIYLGTIVEPSGYVWHYLILPE